MACTTQEMLGLEGHHTSLPALAYCLLVLCEANDKYACVQHPRILYFAFCHVLLLHIT